MGSETPRGFNHGPAMGPGVSTTNNFAFISSGFLTSAALALTRASRIEPLSANVPGSWIMLEIYSGRASWALDRRARSATADMGFNSFLINF